MIRQSFQKERHFLESFNENKHIKYLLYTVQIMYDVEIKNKS